MLDSAPHSRHFTRDLRWTRHAARLAPLLDGEGQVCDYSLNRALVSLTLQEFASIPTKIGVASGLNKAGSILSVLRGGHLDTLVTDEATGARILDLASEEGLSA